ncbi:hypothetical protein C0J52_07532 [Blattella germanica]|nr:hypothetical protein C0J52_07532 [Blattella germanica]
MITKQTGDLTEENQEETSDELAASDQDEHFSDFDNDSSSMSVKSTFQIPSLSTYNHSSEETLKTQFLSINKDGPKYIIASRGNDVGTKSIEPQKTNEGEINSIKNDLNSNEINKQTCNKSDTSKLFENSESDALIGRCNETSKAILQEVLSCKSGLENKLSDKESISVNESKKLNTANADYNTTLIDSTNKIQRKFVPKHIIIPDFTERVADLFEQVSAAYDQEIPEYFLTLAEGLQEYGDTQSSLETKPEWFDPIRHYIGRQVSIKYSFGLQLAVILNLMLVYNIPEALSALIYSGKTDTPFKAFKRYLSTMMRVRSWYLDDVWDSQTEGYKNMRVVRALHENMRNRMYAADPDELEKRTTLSGASNPTVVLQSPLHEKLRADFEGTCPFPNLAKKLSNELHRNRNVINQTEMAFTQFGFVGLFILHPSYFGAHGITDEELDGFIYLWRCIGYFLGMDDKYNFCNGSLEVVKQRSADVLQHIAKPSLHMVSRDWEHMARCFSSGSGFTFEVSVLYLCDILGLHAPRLKASLSFKQRIIYFVTWFIFCVFMRLPGTLEFFNWVYEMGLKRAQTFVMNHQNGKRHNHKKV